MTKVLVFSDIHGDTRALEKIVSQPADIYIADGDLSTFGKGLDRCGEILAPLGERVWVLPGNHESHDEIREFCSRFGFVDFHRAVRQDWGDALGRAWVFEHHAIQDSRRVYRVADWRGSDGV